MKRAKILVIDDDAAMLDLAAFHLRDAGYESFAAESGERGLALVRQHQFDIVLTDLQLPDMDGLEVVRTFKELSPETEIIMVTGYGSVTTAVEATKAGAFYFIEKPVEFEELLVLIEKALERRQQAEEIRQLRGRLANRTSYYNIIGGSKAMQTLFEMIDAVADSDASILITGESGTGKELVANAIHYRSPRSKRALVKVNCAALPKELIESELFGHTKGAFTGATSDKIGLIGQADTGSLFLDEIGEMPLELQPKLLRVLQERVYTRLGGTKPQEVDFRLIAATNRNPQDAIRDGVFREDLYYRINTIEIQVPPLRDRVEDVQHLAEHFLKEFSEKYNRPARTISDQAYARLFSYQWPGNVRELRNAIERAVLLTKGESIETSVLSFAQDDSPTVVAVPAPQVNPSSATESAPEVATPSTTGGDAQPPTASPNEYSIERLAQMIVERAPERGDDDQSPDLFTQIEGAVVNAALERTGGNKQAAANLLGVYRPRLYSMIKKHNIEG